MRFLPPNQLMTAILLLAGLPLCTLAQNKISYTDSAATMQSLITQFHLDQGESNAFLQYVGDNFGKKKMEGMKKNLSLLSADPLMVGEDVWTKLNGFVSLRNTLQLPDLHRGKFFSAKPGNVSVDLLHARPVLTGDQPFTRISIDNSIEILGIPFQIDVMNLTDGFSAFAQGSLARFSFQKDNYMSLLQQNLDKAYSLKDYLMNEYEIVDYLRKQYGDHLKSQLQQLQSEVIPDAESFVFSKFQTDELMMLSEQQIMDKLISPEQRTLMLEQLQANQHYLQQRSDQLTAAEMEQLNSKINGTTDYLRTVDQIKNKLIEQQRKLQHSSLSPQKIHQLQNRLKSQSLQQIKTPSDLGKLTGDLLPLNGLQKFFTQVEKLNIGTFSEESEDATVRTLLSRAGSLSVKQRKNTYTLGTGTMKDVGYLSSTGQQSSQHSPTGNMQHFNIVRKTADEKISSVISLANINIRTLQQPFLQDAAFSRNVFVGSVSKQFPVRAAGIVTAEFSKSASQFHNQVNSAGEAIEQKAAIQTIGEDFFHTMSLGVRYTDQWGQWGLSHNVYIAYSGQGYNNPANASIGRGALLADIQLKKDLKKRKGYINTRYSTRGYNTNMERGADFRNHTYSLGAKYNLHKKARVGGRIDISQMNRLTDVEKQKAYQTIKLTADANITTDIAGLPVRNTAVLSIQEYKSSAYNTGVNSQLLLLSYYGMIPLKQNSVLLNISWNKELAEEFFLSNMLNTEASYQYDLYEGKIQMSSGLTYLNSTGYAEQMGIRQNIYFNYWKNVTIQAFVDARKDLQPPVMSYLYSNFRGTLSIIYRFKSK